ncbi:uncharacterized protein LOC106060468 isoform X2 [Biomphalaria glabrata]|uniref:Uncharacterized protein LOC106060468 isoform X2 n=1 Tax=Biomphalaria glabrata TaxID=6526 RepID=A0A9W2ZXB0_BIOGL|nr:uncharacterized protein LOC106060468 isoform X2 [Biomphalaria glabrata]
MARYWYSNELLDKTMTPILKGSINHIIDPSNFWIQIGTAKSFDEFSRYSEKLNQMYNKSGDSYQISEHFLKEGDKVIVASSENHWNRAQIARINEDTLDVFYVDLGFTEIVSVSQVRSILPVLYNYMSPQVRRMGLAGIRPLSPSWTSRASEFFTDLVVDQILLVASVDTDLVLLFICSDDGSWMSVTEEMIVNEMAVCSGHSFDSSLSREFVQYWHKEADLFSSEELETMSTFIQPESTQVNTVEITNTLTPTNLKDVFELAHNGLEKSPKAEAVQENDSKQISNAKAEISSTNLTTEFFEWGRTDLYVGDVDVFDDVHYAIRQQIFSTDPQESFVTEEDVLQYKRPKPEVQKQLEKPKDIIKVEDNKSTHLNEERAYELEKEILDILQIKDEERYICELVHSIVEPDTDVPSDYLQVVITSVIESLIQNVETQLAFAVLDTYVVSELFPKVLIQVLKTLKERYVKLPQSVRLKGHHQEFVQALSEVFNHSISWCPSMLKPVQDYVVKVLKLWTVFNTQRQQDTESSLNVELMYLECVHTFLMNSSAVLSQYYPDIFNSLILEMKEKMLHDLTPRNVRSFLLSMILTVNKHRAPLKEVAIQTDETVGTQDFPQAEKFTSEVPASYSCDGLNSLFDDKCSNLSNSFLNNDKNVVLDCAPPVGNHSPLKDLVEFVNIYEDDTLQSLQSVCSDISSARENELGLKKSDSWEDCTDSDSLEGGSVPQECVPKSQKITKYTPAELKALKPTAKEQTKSDSKRVGLASNNSYQNKLNAVKKDQIIFSLDELGIAVNDTYQNMCTKERNATRTGQFLSDSDEVGLATRKNYDWRQKELNRTEKALSNSNDVGLTNQFQNESNRNGKIVSNTDEVGLASRKSYDWQQNELNRTEKVLSNSNEIGQSTHKNYDQFQNESNRTSNTDEVGLATRKSYDWRQNELNRKEKVLSDSDELGLTTRKSYDWRQNELTRTEKVNSDEVKQITNKNFDFCQNELNRKAKIVSNTDEIGQTTRKSYDWRLNELHRTEKVHSDSDKTGQTTNKNYDNRLKESYKTRGENFRSNSDKMGLASVSRFQNRLNVKYMKESHQDLDNDDKFLEQPDKSETIVPTIGVKKNLSKLNLCDIAEDFLKSEPDVEAMNASSSESLSEKHMSQGRIGGAGKKKKPKFQPLRGYLEDQIRDQNVEEHFEDQSHEKNIGDIDDVLSPEAVRLYEELENEKRLREEGNVIHPSKLGAVAASSGKRRSLFPQVAQAPAKSHNLWYPKVWRCSRCHSGDHNVYDCPEKDSFDNKFMLI